MTQKHTFRNPDQYPELPYRKWFRGEFANMFFPQIPGISVEDVDLVVTLFGDLIHRHSDEDGRFKIVEVKQGKAKMDYAQRRMYALIDRLLRQGDPGGEHYDGFYIMIWSPPECVVNNTRLSMVQLAEFYLGKFEITPLMGDEIMGFGELV